MIYAPLCMTLLTASIRLGGFQEAYDSVLAFPSVTEKGYFDFQLSVTLPDSNYSASPKNTVRIHESFS